MGPFTDLWAGWLVISEVMKVRIPKASLQLVGKPPTYQTMIPRVWILIHVDGTKRIGCP